MFPLRDTIPSRRLSFVCIFIIVLNVFIFIYESRLGEIEIKEFFRTWGLLPSKFIWSSIHLRNWLPLVSSQFLHAGWLHVLMNMWMLWIFGDNIEDRLGHLIFVFFYLLCGLGAAIAQLVFAGNAEVPMVGASGAISGVMGAYLWLFPHSKIVTFVPIFIFPTVFTISAKFFLLYWFLLQIVAGGMSLGLAGEQSGGIAWWAHIGGFATGFVYAALFIRRSNE